MGEIAWHLLQPVDVGAQVQQGFATGQALVKQIQGRNALRAYLANPDDPNAYGALAQFDPQAAASIERQQMLRRKEALDQQDRQRQTALGGLYNADPAAAREEAIGAGDFELAKQFDALDEQTRKRTAETWQHVGPIAYRLKQTPDPAARAALWEQARPILEASGADAKTLDKFDPNNDAQIEAALTTSQKVSELIDQGKITWHQQGEQPSFATDSMGRPVGSQNPYAKTTAAMTYAQPPAVANDVAETLSEGGLPPHVVAGFLGNFHAEGGYGGAKGDGGSASGIAQWRGERATNFQRIIGKSPTEATPAEQAEFVLWEMDNPEAAGMSVGARDAILNAPTAEAAAALIDQNYERSSGEHRGKRTAAARQFAMNMGASHHVATKAEFDKLPSGAVFVAPDGSTRRKP